MTVRRLAVAAGMVLAVAGCGVSGTATPAPPAVATPPTTSAPVGSPDAQLCARSGQIVSSVRDSAHILDLGPVLPPAISLLFLAVRQMAEQSGLTEPAVRTASTEMVAAIDDLSAQSGAARPTVSAPAGAGDLGEPVRYETKRVVAAAAGLEKACAARR